MPHYALLIQPVTTILPDLRLSKSVMLQKRNKLLREQHRQNSEFQSIDENEDTTTAAAFDFNAKD